MLKWGEKHKFKNILDCHRGSQCVFYWSRLLNLTVL